MADDLRSLLTDAVAAQETLAEPVEREKSESAPAVAETEKPASSDRPRGPDGKFLPKEESEAELEADEPVETVADGEEEEPEETAATPPAVEVPQHWSQADKDMVAALPPEHRGKVVDTYKRIEAGFTPKLQRAAEIERQYGPVQDIFAPAAELMKQRGVVPADIIRAWHGVERDLLSGPEKGAQVVARLIQNYRIDPGAVAAILQGQIATVQPQSADLPNGELPPAVAAAIRAAVQPFEERENARITKERETAIAATQSRIDAFAAEKDAAGNLLHPYFAELEYLISGFARLEIDQGKTPDLADLYDRAIYANRETREKLLASKEEEAKRKAAAERKAKAAVAQKASASITGSPMAGQSPSEQRGKTRTLRDDIEASIADIDAA